MQLCPQGEDGAPQIEMWTLCVGKGPHPQPIVIEGGREVLCWAINPPGAMLDAGALVVRSVKKR